MSGKVKSTGALFVLDVHTEPLPARFVAPALEQLATGAARMLEGRITHGPIISRGTMRHLILEIADVAARGLDTVESFKGPKASAARKPDGTFTPAAEGFARKHNLPAADLEEKDGIMYARVERHGEDATTVLASMCRELLGVIQFPKSMVWEETGFRFGRPIRALTALYGERVVSFELAGLHAGRDVFGHPAFVETSARAESASDVGRLLSKGMVVSDPAARREVLVVELDRAAKAAGGRVESDDELLLETVDMVESPAAVLGSLRPEHMNLPSALLKLVLKKQLKFFPVVDSRGGLLPAFVGVRDGASSSDALVRDGYQRVIEARFNDAAFFHGRDLKNSLESRLPALDRITYQAALGSMGQKAARVESLTSWLAEHLRQTAPIDEASAMLAAKLAYADLVTDVVREFPELQGTMGGVYARSEKLPERAALAIEEFYAPASAKAPVPSTGEGAVVSLAGKLDGLAGCFAAGLIPSGSADPYALRRQALGAVRIIAERGLPIDIDAALARALALQPVAPGDAASSDKRLSQLRDFVWARAAAFLEEAGFAVDEIRAVRSRALQDLPGAFRRLAALRAVRRDPAFEPLAAAFKRASNILKQSPGGLDEEPPVRSLLRDEAELAFYDALVEVEGAANDRLTRGDYEGALKSLVAIKPHLDRFFDQVMVMVDDPMLKRQRLAVLGKLVRAFTRVADLSEIQAAAS